MCFFQRRQPNLPDRFLLPYLGLIGSFVFDNFAAHILQHLLTTFSTPFPDPLPIIFLSF